MLLPLWLLLTVFNILHSLIRPLIAPRPGGILWVAKPTESAYCAAVAEKLFDEANTFRIQNGLPALCANKKLKVAAWNHANRMTITGEFAHTLSDGLDMSSRVTRCGYRFTSVRENIAWHTWIPSPFEVSRTIHIGWVNSPGHCENLLASDVTELGVAVCRRFDGRVYAVQNFGSRSRELSSAAVPLTTSDATLKSFPTKSFDDFLEVVCNPTIQTKKP